MTIKLYGIPASRTMRVLWALDEVGQSYEHDPISYADPALKTKPYTDINPNGKVPFLVDGGFVVFESLAITAYLAEQYPCAISPTNPQERAGVVQWATWVLTECEQHTFNWYLNTSGKSEAERDPDVAKAATRALTAPFAVLEQVLSKNAFLLGARFTVADLNVACTLYRAMWMDLSATPHLSKWLTSCFARPGGLVARRARGEQV